MKLIPHITILTLSGFLYTLTFAQTSTNDIKAAQQIVDDEQKDFRDFLMMTSMSDNIKKDLQRFAVNDVNNIQNNLQYLATAARDRRIKGIRSLSYFMKEIKQQFQDKKLNQFDIPLIVRKYKQTLTDLLNNKTDDPLKRILRP
jgi:membrane-associated HD superfamily phosphohydrolase